MVLFEEVPFIEIFEQSFIGLTDYFHFFTQTLECLFQRIPLLEDVFSVFDIRLDLSHHPFVI